MQKISRSTFLWCIVGSVILCGIINVCLTNIDLKITKAIINTDSNFCSIFAHYSLLPTAVLLFAALNILLSISLRSKRKVYTYFLMIVYVLLMIVFNNVSIEIFFSTASPIVDFTSSMKHYASAITLIIIITLQFIFYRMPLASLKSYEIASKITAASYVGCFIVMSIIKNIWGRLSPFEIMDDNFSGFTPWYLPAHLGGGSFPSGHTIFATMILCLAFYANTYKKKLFVPTLSFCVIYSITVAVCRVIFGAHFATDVTTGFFITVCIISLFCFAFHAEKMTANNS